MYKIVIVIFSPCFTCIEAHCQYRVIYIMSRNVMCDSNVYNSHLFFAAAQSTNGTAVTTDLPTSMTTNVTSMALELTKGSLKLLFCTNMRK